LKVFVCDNYDSFTFNLVQYLGELGAELVVARNDEVSPTDVAALSPDAVVISPGPGTPAEAGMSIDLVRWCAQTETPLLGVCLGHQAIGEAFGAVTTHAPRVMHGKTSTVSHDGLGIFAGVANPIEAMRYHSLVVDERSLGPDLVPTARTQDGVLMGMRHRTLQIEGVQFHPESVLTEVGRDLLRNFLSSRRRP
jgi:anthranilate synthase component II